MKAGRTLRKMQLSVKLYQFCAFLFFIITVFAVVWGNIFPFSAWEVHVSDQYQFSGGISSLIEHTSIENLEIRKRDFADNGFISESATFGSSAASLLNNESNKERLENVLSNSVEKAAHQHSRDQAGVDQKQKLHLMNESRVSSPSRPTQELSGTIFIRSKGADIISEQKIEQSSHLNCDGKRVYMYDLPPQFNTYVLQRCNKSMVNWLNFCPHIANAGFGQPLKDEAHGDWYATDAYMLEVIYHNRMKSYPCRTHNSSQADAFFIPYYTGLDALRYIYGTDKPNKHKHGLELMQWLQQNAQDTWERRGGKDHFIVMGRTAWDFSCNPLQNELGWGTSLLELKDMENVTSLLLEKRPWRWNEQAVPYPTSFHPSSLHQLQQWINMVESSKREFLFAFTGAPRPQMRFSIRGALFNQCNASSACTVVDCAKIKCSHNPIPIMKGLVRSKFCLQPAGDTATRRSTFDSIIAGCIPVFFNNDSAYTQYTWHLPGNPDQYSVFIAEDDVRKGNLVEEVLKSYSDVKIQQLQSNIRQLIPRIVYIGDYRGMFGSADSYISAEDADEAVAGDGGMLRTNQVEADDAFEMSIKGMLNRVAGIKHEQN